MGELRGLRGILEAIPADYANEPLLEGYIRENDAARRASNSQIVDERDKMWPLFYLARNAYTHHDLRRANWAFHRLPWNIWGVVFREIRAMDAESYIDVMATICG